MTCSSNQLLARCDWLYTTGQLCNIPTLTEKQYRSLPMRLPQTKPHLGHCVHVQLYFGFGQTPDHR